MPRFLLRTLVLCICLLGISPRAHARVHAEDESIRVVSWNAHALAWPIVKRRDERLERLVDRIREERVEVALLQEVWDRSWRTLERAAGEDFTVVRVQGLFGWSRGGLVALVRNDGPWRVNPQSVHFRKYRAEASAWRFWQGDGLANKGALFFEVVHRDSGRHLALVDTHLQARYRVGGYVDVRRRQIEELTSWVAQLDTSPGVVVGGDLNATPSEPLLHERVLRLGADLASGFRDGTGALRRSDVPTVRRDYVLLRSDSPQGWRSSARILDKRSNGFLVSDHHGVAVDLTPPLEVARHAATPGG